MAVLMAARVLQGTSAALVWTVGLALCLETVGPENLGKTLGSVGLYSRYLTFGATN
jgi:predicted MFS family arabinose efflux permease